MANSILTIEDLTRRVEQGAVVRALVPETFRLSLWVPLLQPVACKLYLTAFFYESPVAIGQPRRIYRPSRQIAVDPFSGRIVSYEDSAYSDFAGAIPASLNEGAPRPIVGEASPKDAPARTVEEMQELYKKLYASYDRILGICCQPVEQLSVPDRADIKEFVLLFDRLSDPGLTPFYHALNPAFFNWLEMACAV